MGESNLEPMLWPGLAGSRALVTGASSGIGQHFAHLLAKQGVQVTLAARREERLEKVCEAITAAGGQADALIMDVASKNSIETAMAGKVFDIVVNNAGTTASIPALELGVEEVDQIIDINLKGALYVAQTAAQSLKDEGRPGCIINVASILGLRVAGHVSAYAASKAGLIQLSKALALEWARYGIRVNTLCPGYIETDLNRSFFESDAGKALIRRVPLRRLGQPDDLDGAFLLMASDLGRFMTGTDITVDGGHLVSSI